jgi:DNA modification methylase
MERQAMTVRLIHGDALEMLATLPAASVQTVVTSPPYFGLRRYTDDAREIGQEETPAWYAAALVAVFRDLRRVLRDDGTAWLNLGDSYAMNGTPGMSNLAELGKRYSGGGHKRDDVEKPARSAPSGIAPKNLLGIPWRVAFALQDDGWYLRSDIIWSKPNAMPESVTDRPTRSHEYLFLLSKQPRYYYDAAAIAEPIAQERPTTTWAERKEAGEPMRRGDPGESGYVNHTATLNSNTSMRNRRTVWSSPDLDSERAAFGLYLTNLARRLMDAGIDSATIGDCLRQAEQDNLAAYATKGTAWSIATQPYSGAHFATMPEALVAPCILAGSSAQACEHCGAAWGRVVESTGHVNTREPAHVPNNSATKTDSTGWAPTSRATDRFAPRCSCPDNTGSARSTVLDPFAGSGTVLRVAQRFQRDAIGIDLNADYLELQEQRNNGVQIEMDML